MTGEVALHGEVGSVGGILHKVRAAAKAGRKVVIVPSANAAEAQAAAAEVGVQIHAVAAIEEALSLCLVGDAPAPGGPAVSA
jgi:predicted ATP-dependent protease